MERVFDAISTGNKIRLLREERKLSQFKLGDKLDLTGSHIGRIERDDCIASVKVYVEIAQFFGVSLDYLLTDRTNEEVRVKMKMAMEILEGVEREMR